MRKKMKACVHCSATREGSRLTFEQCNTLHKKRFSSKGCGYNIYIELDGTVYLGRPFGSQLAHAKGHNSDFLAMCYEGGLDANGKPKDTRTEAQKQSMIVVKLLWEKMFEVTEWMGHRDLSPDVNHDGIITPNEWLKACPCFDVKTEFL